MGMHAARRERLRARLREAELDALVVTHLPNIRYLSGFTGSSATLLVAGDGEERLATDGRYDEQCAAEAPDLPRTITRGDDWLQARAGGRVGVESQHISWDRARRLGDLLGGVEASPGHVEALRQTKDAEEVASLRRACAITAEAFVAACAWIGPGMTERALARRLLAELEDRGSDGWSFEPIIASGPNGALPHHRAGERVLAAGDLVTLDFGGIVDGYHADMTRTVAIGEPVGELRAAYEAVRAAQAAGVQAVRHGVEAGVVDAACRQALTDAGYGEAFVHPTGHALGLEIHEEPILRAGAAARLASRMTVTVEPGAYLPGVGGVRIEDVVLVGPDGCESLTPAPKDLVVL